MGMNETIIANATTGVTIGLSTQTSWFSLVMIVGMCAVVMSLFFMAISTLERYKKIKKWIDGVGKSLTYFIIGLMTLVCLAVPGLIIYMYASQAAKGNVAPLWMTAVIIGIYFAVSALGWVAKKFVVDRVAKFEKILKEDANVGEGVA